MGFLDKMFGTKVSDDNTVAEPREIDFVAALSMQLRGEVAPAFDAYQRIAEKLPNNNLAPFFASAAKACKGEIAEAAENLSSLSQRTSSKGETISQAITMDLVALMNSEPFLSVPAIVEIIVNFGDLLKQEGFLQGSAVCFEIATGFSPDNAHVLHKFGDTLHDLRIYDYAEKVLLEALKYAPNHWGAIYTYAVLLQDLGRFPEAITYYEKALKQNPDHAKCQNNYGAALMMTNQLDEALAHCTLAAELDPDFPFARINLGNIHLLMHSYEAARNCFTEAISLDGNLPKGFFGLASVEELLGTDSGRILELYLKAIEINPAFPEAHHALGNFLAREGKLEALEHFSAAERLDSTQMSLQKDFGTACLQFGQREEAIKHLKLALQQNPDDEATREIIFKTEEEIPD